MYAIVDISGQQTPVKPNAVVKAPLQNGKPGDVLEFNNILLSSNDTTTTVGSPFVKGTVKAKIISHLKDEKVVVFKKRRRKGTRKFNGHRQNYSVLEIIGMNIDGFDKVEVAATGNKKSVSSIEEEINNIKVHEETDFDNLD